MIIDTTAATVITVKTVGSSTPARTHSVQSIRLNSDIWFISRPIMKMLCDFSLAIMPRPMNNGSVAKMVKSASPNPIGSDSSIV